MNVVYQPPLVPVEDEISTGIEGAEETLAAAGQAIDQASTRMPLRNTP